MCNCRHLLGACALIILLTAGGVATVRATTVSTSLITCPLCGQRYAACFITSYFAIGPDDVPPGPIGTCPHCLYTWTGHGYERTLDPAEARRVRAAILAWPQSLSPEARKRVLERANSYSSTFAREQEVKRHLASYCEAARLGNTLPVFHPLARSRLEETSESDQAKQQDFLERLPGLLAAQRADKPTSPGGRNSGEAFFDSDRTEMFFTLIPPLEQGNPPAVEYFLRWSVGLREKDLVDSAFYVARGLAVLAEHPSVPWPASVDTTKTRTAFVADCLRYVHQPDVPLPDSLRQRVNVRQSFQPFSEAVLQLCAARRDRALVAAVARELDFRKSYPDNNIFWYYMVVGTEADLPFLGKYVRVRVKAFDAAKLGRRNGFEIEKAEDAIRSIQVRTLLATGKLTDY